MSLAYFDTALGFAAVMLMLSMLVTCPTSRPGAILAVQRIILEALTNSLRHAQASAVTLSVQAEGGWLRIQPADDGVGFKAPGASR